MNHNPSWGRASLPPTLAEEVDHVCDRFEAAWKEVGSAAAGPAVREYLDGVTEPARSVLLAELLGLELAYRRRRGERPHVAEYQARFPGHDTIIDAVWRDCDSQATPSPAGTVPFPAANPAAAGREGVGFPKALPAPFGRYRLLKLLGQGGMGAVYLAHDTQLDRNVALKVPRFTPDDGPQVLARFYREARAAATFRHPNICPLHDVGEIDGTPYLTMAYIDGKSLSDFARLKPLTHRQSALLVRKLALALEEAHKHGVIHRDLKPANVMIDKRGEPVVMDFGLARRGQRQDPRLTRSGAVLGTPAYMPPEQVKGDVVAMGPAGDVYSLGVILYQLLTGRLPFNGQPIAVMCQILQNEPPRPSTLREGLDPELEAICLKAMAKKIEDRYGSMSDLAAALLDYLRKKTVGPKAPDRPAPAAETAPPTAPVPEGKPLPFRAPQAPRRRRVTWPLWLVGAAAAVLLPLLGRGLYTATDYGSIRIDLSEAAAPVAIAVDKAPGPHVGESVKLRTGEHRVEVTGQDYETVDQAFTVRRGDNPPLLLELTPKYGDLRIDLGDPKSPVEVRIDGAAVSTGDLDRPLRLRPGEHRLQVSGADFDEANQNFTVHGGSNPVLSIPLHRKSKADSGPTPGGDWFIVTDDGFATSNPNHLVSRKLQELRQDARRVVNCIACTPTGDWVILYDGNRFATSNPDLPACKQMAAWGTDHTLQCVAFAPGGGWEIFHDEYLSSGGEDLPPSALKTIQQVTQDKALLRSVTFGPDGHWVLLHGENDVFFDPKPPTDLEELLTDLVEKKRLPVRCVAFTPAGDWFVLGGDNDCWSNNPDHPAYKKLKELRSEHALRWIAFVGGAAR